MKAYEDEELLRDLHSRGLTQYEIADEIGCCQATVSNKLTEFNIGSSECVTCGGSYDSLGVHWSTTCKHPELTDRQHEIITGCLMGDASVWRPKEGGYPVLSLSMTNKEFLGWFEFELSEIISQTRLKNTAKESAELTSRLNGGSVNVDTHNDVYSCNTFCHPELSEYREWYSSGQKRFPELELTPLILSCWYCCDGSLSGHRNNEGKYSNVMFSSLNESDRYDFLTGLFEDIGFNPSSNPPNIWFGKDESARILRWMDGPLPGFDYKWDHPGL